MAATSIHNGSVNLDAYKNMMMKHHEQDIKLESLTASNGKSFEVSIQLEPPSTRRPTKKEMLFESIKTPRKGFMQLESISLNLGDQPMKLGDRSLQLRDRSLELGHTSLQLADTSLQLADTSLQLGDTFLHFEDTSLHFGDTSLQLGDTSLELGDTSLQLEDQSLQLYGVGDAARQRPTQEEILLQELEDDCSFMSLSLSNFKM